MKVVILAGGFGTRISEESHLKPKPMIEIGEKPILWHIMKEYSAYGINEFIICAGYKQHVIKEWFADYFIHTSDITFDFTKGNEMIIHNKHAEPWKVTVVDTGLNTQTGGRIKRVKDFVGDDTFMVRTTIAGAIINVLVNLALIRFIGLYAASISTLVSYASTALYRRIDIRKYIKIKVNVKNILLNSVAVVFVTLSYYFNITILNVAALVIACIYAVGINWKLIKMFFAEIRKYKKEGN